MKKILCLLLCVLMAVGMLASCGSSSSKVSTKVIDKTLDDIRSEASGDVVVVDVYDDSQEDGALLSIGNLDTSADYVTVLRNDLSIKDDVLKLPVAPAVIEKSSYEGFYNKLDSSAQSLMDSYYTLIEKGEATDAQARLFPASADMSIYVLDTSVSLRDRTSISGYVTETGYTAEDMFNDMVKTGLVPTPNSLLEAHVVTADEVETEEVDGGIAITSYTGTAQNIVVPSEIDGKAVITIGKGAFALSTIHAVTVQDGVKNINTGAFSCAYGLMNIYLPDSVNDIEENAFGCALFTTEEDGFVSIGSEKDIYLSYTGSDAEITVPDGVRFICGAFAKQNKTLTSVKLPEGLISIGKEAFKLDETITSINLPSTLTKICDGALYQIRGVTSYEIPDSVTEIGDEAFYDNTGMTSLVFGENLQSIGARAFRYASIEAVTLPDSLTYIGDEAFLKSPNLTTVNGGANVTYIGGNAFDSTPYYSNLTADADGFCLFAGNNKILLKYTGQGGDVVLPTGITSISSAFCANAKVTSVIINEDCLSIAYNAFGNASRITTITIPASVTTIDDKAFDGIESNVTLKVEKGSYAETFANSKHITVE